MGNVLLQGPKKGDPAEQYQRWLEQNPDLVGKQILSENKLFRTSSYKFNGRSIIIKVFFKRDQSPLTQYLKIFQFFNQIVQKYKATNIAPLKLFTQRDNQSFVVAYRQKMAQTLEGILCAKPTTTQSKKKWLIYQMIKSVYAVHKHFNFYHGNIRTSNFVLTTYGYLMLTDFAFYKPLFMLEDTEEGLPQFRLFYGSSVNNCTLAPQKITEQADLKNKQRSPAKIFSSYQPSATTSSSFSVNLQSTSYNTSNNNETTRTSEISIPPNILTLTTSRSESEYAKSRDAEPAEINRNQINYFDQIYNLQKMDIFSLGCSILQVLRDGKPIMNFESYLKFKKGEMSLEPFIDQACKSIDNGQPINKMLKSMLSLFPDDRPNIEQILDSYSHVININTYSLIWHCTSAFSTTSFFLPDLRISLMQALLKFIEIEERGTCSDFKIMSPKCFESFQALKIFKSILKNKIIHVGHIPEGSILKKIMEQNQKQNVFDSEEQEIMNQCADIRKQFFVPLVAKKNNLSTVRMSTASIPKLQKILTPPQWDRQLKNLVSLKFRGLRLTPNQLLKNRFQDLLEQYRKTQSIRQIRIKHNSTFYKEYNMVIRIVFSCIRGCKYNSSKLIGIELLMTIAKESSDTVRLLRMIPTLINLLDDPDTLTCKHAFNSIIDVFYMFINPFKGEEQTHYYDIIVEMFINCIKTPRLRINLFRRLTEVYHICEWLEVHIVKICKKLNTKNSLKKLVDILKNDFGSYQSHQIRELMMNIPDIMWPEMFEFFISFLNSQKILGLQKGISIAQVGTESYKKIIDVIDNCIETSLDENGFSLYYAIRYFTVKQIDTPMIVKKIGPLVIHPHVWVRESARDYIAMCLDKNPPTRIFFLFREIFAPPFPLQPKDMTDNILLPEPLLESQVDFAKKKLKSTTRKLGVTQKHFSEYLEKVKPSKSYPITKEQQVQQWINLSKNILEQKIEPTSFNSFIKKTIYELYEANFLYYVGNAKSPFKHNVKEEQKKKAYQELNEALKKMNIMSLEDNQVAYEKKDFFISLSTIVNSNFEKLLTRFIKQDKSNKIRISESIYLIMETLYKFEQFNIKQTFKLGEFNSKVMEPQKTERLKGNLITQIYEHKDMITCLENVADRFLISGSYDGTVRVFNIRKIETNITCESEGIYEINSDNTEEKVRINSLAAFQNTYTIAAATNRGNIRIFQIERMKGKGFQMNRMSTKGESQQLKYFVGGEIEKILTFKNQNRNECFCFVTAQGILGVQDIRARSKTMSCNLGKERGLPKALAFSNFGPSILVGTLDGYVLTYDIRCNLISSIKQLQMQQSPVSITGIYPSPYLSEGRNMFAFTYPSKHYEFSYFDVYLDGQQFAAERHYSSCDRDDLISVPTMVNKTKQENFKLCNNTLTQKIYYKQLSDFNRNFKILDYLSDPFTVKQSKIREIWMDRCKHRYNQIYSIYNKKVLPFIEHTQTGIMTNMNPCITSPGEKKSNRNLAVLVDRIETKQYYEVEKLVTCKPPNSKIYTFQDEQNADYLTCSKALGNMVFVGGWDSVIKVYR